MLNEIEEFRQYTERFQKCTRLKSMKNKKTGESSKIDGIERAMLVIARGNSFDSDGNFSEEKGLLALNDWCGFSGENSFLEKYLGAEFWEKKISGKQKQYNKSMYDFKSEENDFKEITFERILADAFEAGPLKEYYLVCKKDFYEKCAVYNSQTKEQPKWHFKDYIEIDDSTNPGKAIGSILKIIACYLLSKPADSNYAYINQTVLENWGTVHRGTLWKYSYDDEQIYKKEESGDNTIVLIIPKDFRENFSIVESSEIDNYSKDEYVFWSDPGTGDIIYSLRFGKKY